MKEHAEPHHWCGREQFLSEQVMKIYYLSMFILTIISFLVIWYRYEIRRTNYYYLILMVLMMISNAGYLAVALSNSVGEVILANKIVHIGGCFIPAATLSLICTLTNYKMPSWMKSIIYGFSGFVYAMVLTSGYSELYYKDVYLKTYRDVTVIGNVPGVGNKLYYVILLGHALISMLLICWAFKNRRKISQKFLISLALIVVVNMYLYFIGKFINPSIEIMPLTYAISSGILVYMYRKGAIYNLDDNIKNSQKRDHYAYIMFDKNLNFLGCNYMAEIIFP